MHILHRRGWTCMHMHMHMHMYAHLAQARLDMCIFAEEEHAAFAEAFASETVRAQQFTASLGMGRTPTQPWQTGKGP